MARLARRRMMLHGDLNLEVEPRCIAVWKEPWANRIARVTLFVDSGDKFVIVADTSNGFWFLPGGGVEQSESVEEAAKREALEELGLKIEVKRVIATFNITLISKEDMTQTKIPPFIAVHATPKAGELKTEYAPNRKIIQIRKRQCRHLLSDFKLPYEYECMKPHHYVSKEIVRQFIAARDLQ